MKNSVLYVLLLLSLCFSACKNEPEPEPSPCSYGLEWTDITSSAVPQSGLIPFHPNNYWVYADSTFDENGNLVEAVETTMAFSEIRVTGTDTFWTAPNFGTFSPTGDSVYVLENTYPYGCANRRLEFFPVGPDTLEYAYILEGDMVMQRYVWQEVDTIRTPAGDFGSCFHYDLWGEGKAFDIVQPEVGIVIIHREYNLGEKRTYTLKNYNLE